MVPPCKLNLQQMCFRAFCHYPTVIWPYCKIYDAWVRTYGTQTAPVSHHKKNRKKAVTTFSWISRGVKFTHTVKGSVTKVYHEVSAFCYSSHQAQGKISFWPGTFCTECYDRPRGYISKRDVIWGSRGDSVVKKQFPAGQSRISIPSTKWDAATRWTRRGRRMMSGLN